MRCKICFSPDGSGILSSPELVSGLERYNVQREIAPKNYFLAINLGSVSITLPHFSQVLSASEL